MSDVNTQQVGGTHYRTKFQHWDFTLTVLQGRYLEGCITKYISRWRKKNGLEDLKKSAHYLRKLITVVQGPDTWVDHMITVLMCRWMPSYPSLNSLHGLCAARPDILQFCEDNQLHPDETSIMLLVSDWKNIHDLEVALDKITAIIEREQGIHDEIEQMRQDNP